MLSWMLVIIIFFVVAALVFLDFHLTGLKIAFFLVLILIVYFLVVGFVKNNDFDFSSPKKIVGNIYSYAVLLFDTGVKVIDIGRDSITTLGNAIRGNETENLKS